MPTPANAYHASAPFSLNDIYLTIFRHKWKILFCFALGLAAATITYFFTPVSYRSQAKLLVRYVTETAAVDPEMTGNRMLTPDSRGISIINTELHILTSQDVIGTVIEQVGMGQLVPDREGDKEGLRGALSKMIGKLRPDKEETGEEETDGQQLDRSLLALMIVKGLEVSNPKNTSIINLDYYASAPGLAQLTLRSLIDAYLNKHYEIHRAMGAYGFLSQQVDQSRSRLTQTEEELRTLQGQIGFSSVKEAETAVSAKREALQQQIWQLEAELAGVVAESGIIEKWLASGGSLSGSISGSDDPSAGSWTSFGRGAMPDDSLSVLKRREAALLSVFTEGSKPVTDLRLQIARMTEQTRASAVTNEAGSTADMSPTTDVNSMMDPDLLSAQARIASLEARIKTLSENLEQIQAKGIEDRAATDRIAELQRKKEIEEANYRYFSQSLERARIDASLDAEKLANISIVQPATYPAGAWRSPTFIRNVLVALALGLFGGLGLAFFMEKIADQSIRQPAEVETTLSAPLLLTIPRKQFSRRALSMQHGRGAARLLPAHGSEVSQTRGAGGATDGKSWILQSDLKPYFEALRDRVIAYGKATDLSKPCLLGLTSCTHGSGVTTMAAGLALTLARNGDGRVLFVDLSGLDHGTGNSLLDSAENVRLADILADDTGRTTVMQPNLFVLSAREVTDEAQSMKPSPRIEDVIEQLRRSDYDYVVLDMPPVSETSPALRIAPQIDGVMLIVRAEKVARTTARKARNLLDQAQAHMIGAILNRTRRYVPQWLQQE